MLNQNDEIVLFNTDKLNVHKLERSTDLLGFENIVDIVIPQYYNLKIIHSKKMVEHHSEKPAKNHLFHHDQKNQHYNVKTVDDITKTVNFAVNKSAPDQKSKEKTNSLNDSNNDDESDLIVKINPILPPLIEEKKEEPVQITPVETNLVLTTNDIQISQEEPVTELKPNELKQKKNITKQKPVQKN